MLVTFCTPNYVDRLLMLIASYRRSNPHGTLRVYGVCWPDALVARMREAFPEYRFHPHPGTPEIQADIASGKRSGAVLRLKPELLLRTYNEAAAAKTPVVWVDADTLVMRPVAPLISRVDAEGDYGVTFRPTAHDFAKFAVAVMYYRHTAGGGQMLRQYAAEAAKTKGYGNWYQDQLSLWHVRQRLQFSRLVPLLEREHSILGNTDAIFVSRRPKFDLPQMRDFLTSKHIEIPELA